jgi:predicted transcriptional regulator
LANLSNNANHSGRYELRVFEEEIIFNKYEKPEKDEDPRYFTVDDIVDDETINHCDEGPAYSEKKAEC